MKKSRLFIFAGHSTKSVGAKGNGLEEHFLAQRLVEEIISHIGNLADDIEIITKEYDDKYSREYLFKRCKLVNDNCKGYESVAIDVHFNAFMSPEAKGTEVWHYPKSAKGRTLAELLNVVMMKYFFNRGVKETDKFYFLKHTSCPAVILEVCFITSSEDIHQYLRKRKRIAKDIAKAIVDYFRVVEE